MHNIYLQGFLISTDSSPPGENSLIRIPVSPAHRIKVIELKENMGTFGFIQLGEYKKVLDGAHCDKIGNPTELRNWEDK